MMRITTGALFVGLSLIGGTTILRPAHAETKACPAKTYDSLRKPASEGTKAVPIVCDVTLSKADVITVPIVFSRSVSSGVVFDCGGATLDGTVAKARTVLVRSVQKDDGSWDVPRDILIRNCTIKGDVRIQGLGSNGQGPEVKRSSFKPGHTQRAQAAAPANITFDNVTFVASGGIPLYAAPGVTGMVVRNSRFIGRSDGTAIYLDAESARNAILGNTFNTRTSMREQIAVDGSAENRIEGNKFDNPVNGGVFLYRNCGEGGTIRQQKPQGNVIVGNTFQYSRSSDAKPAVWLGSRRGISMFNSYCLTNMNTILDSLDHRDGAQGNTVIGNLLPGGSPRLIVDDDRRNKVSDNR